MNKKIWSVLVIAGLLLTGCSMQADDFASTGNNKATERTAQKTSSSKATKVKQVLVQKKIQLPVHPQIKNLRNRSKSAIGTIVKR